MHQMNEEHELLCKYPPQLNIPSVITVSAYTTRMEQLRLSSENFHQVMIEHILPEIITPSIPVKELYEVDYYMILRRARLATWGPIFTAASYYCPYCKNADGSRGVLWREKAQVNLSSIGVLLPDANEEIPTSVTVSRDELLFTDADVTFTLNKCKDLLLIEKTKVADHLRPLLNLAASLRTVTGLDFIDITEAVSWLADLPAADFRILQTAYQEAFGYGLSSKGELACKHCGQPAWFFAPINDYFFRPTREDLKEWKRILQKSEEPVRWGNE